MYLFKLSAILLVKTMENVFSMTPVAVQLSSQDSIVNVSKLSIPVHACVLHIHTNMYIYIYIYIYI